MLTSEDFVTGAVLRLGEKVKDYNDYIVEQDGEQFRLRSKAFPELVSDPNSIEAAVIMSNAMGFNRVKESSDVDQG